MDVRVGVLRAIHLDHPVHGRKIHSSRRNIRAEQYSMLLFNELEVDRCALVLVLLAMQFEQVLIDFERLKGLVCESNLFSRREEDQDLLLLMCFQEAEKRV